MGGGARAAYQAGALQSLAGIAREVAPTSRASHHRSRPGTRIAFDLRHRQNTNLRYFIEIDQGATCL
jgi:hypothetical protein